MGQCPGGSASTGSAGALDRYGRSLEDLMTMVGELRKREIGFTAGPGPRRWEYSGGT